MRFIVDLYRFIIVAFCAVALIGGAVALFAALDTNGPLAGAYPGWVSAIAAAVAVMFILTVGGLAMIISIHDRHAELANAAGTTAAALERIADRLDRLPSPELQP